MFTKSRIRVISSVFFLGIFLSFYATKDIHDILHSGDEHCHVLNAQHYHSPEHHCALCDYAFQNYDNALAFRLSFKPYSTSAVFLITEQNLALGATYSLQSRGPPQAV